MPAMSQLILTAVGPDRLGLVADLTRYVHEAGASLADSRMVNLRGHFALLALVEGSGEALAQLRRALAEGSAKLGLRLDVKDVDAATAPAPGSLPYRLKGYAPDQPGIVARVTDVLRQHHVNIEEFETRVESTPFSGTPMFVIESVVTLPKGMSVRALRQDLEALGDRIGCDVDLDPL